MQCAVVKPPQSRRSSSERYLVARGLNRGAAAWTDVWAAVDAAYRSGAPLPLPPPSGAFALALRRAKRQVAAAAQGGDELL